MPQQNVARKHYTTDHLKRTDSKLAAASDPSCRTTMLAWARLSKTAQLATTAQLAKTARLSSNRVSATARLATNRHKNRRPDTRPARRRVRRRPRARLAASFRSEVLGADERGVAEQDERIAVKALQAVTGHQGRVTGALLLGLVNDLDVITRRVEGGLHLRRTMARHNDDPARVRRPGRVERVHQHRGARDRVQDLGQVGFHARSLARGENDDGKRHMVDPGWSGFGAFYRDLRRR